MILPTRSILIVQIQVYGRLTVSDFRQGKIEITLCTGYYDETIYVFQYFGNHMYGAVYTGLRSWAIQRTGDR